MCTIICSLQGVRSARLSATYSLDDQRGEIAENKRDRVQGWIEATILRAKETNEIA